MTGKELLASVSLEDLFWGLRKTGKVVVRAMFSWIPGDYQEMLESEPEEPVDLEESRLEGQG